MKNIALVIIGLLVSFGIGFYLSSSLNNQHNPETTNIIYNTSKENKGNMKLGAFSLSLSVKDINTSKAFYESLGFIAFAGDVEQNYLIMKNDNCLIGLFQGMFEGNILTFNPGWDESANSIENFQDIREIQKHLKKNGIKINPEVDENSTGPANFMLTDPDGNVILFDQHI